MLTDAPVNKPQCGDAGAAKNARRDTLHPAHLRCCILWCAKESLEEDHIALVAGNPCPSVYEKPDRNQLDKDHERPKPTPVLNPFHGLGGQRPA